MKKTYFLLLALITILSSTIFAQDGSVDADFGTDGIVTTDFNYSEGSEFVATQSDGKIVSVGWASFSGKTDFAIVRYNIDGSLDDSFGTNGVVMTDFGSDYNALEHDYDYNVAHSMAFQADGKIVVVGNSRSHDSSGRFALVRYNSNGSLDSTFGSMGKVREGLISRSIDGCTDVAIQSDGKIVVVGTSSLNLNRDFLLARYNRDGTLDESFGIDGFVTTDIGETNNYAKSLAIRFNGQIVVAGTSSNESKDFTLVRYNSNGSLDRTFGTDGIVFTDFGGSDDVVSSMAINDGIKIAVVGYSSIDDDNSDIALALYNLDGSLISHRNANIRGTNNKAYSVVFHRSGDIVVASSFKIDRIVHSALTKYCTNCIPENLDLNLFFGPNENGIVTTELDEGIRNNGYCVTTQADGKIFTTGRHSFELAKYNRNGSLDNTFGTDGRVRTEFKGIPKPKKLVIKSNGKIIVAGSVYDLNRRAYFMLAQYNRNGLLDRRFGNRGIVITDFSDYEHNHARDFVYDRANSVAIQSNGKIVVVGYSRSGIAIARYNSNGTLDNSFGNNGKIRTHFGGSVCGEDVVIQSNGKILVAGGAYSDESGARFALVRYNSDGSLDITFGSNGIVTTDIIDGNGDAGKSVVIQSTGKIVVIGSSSDNGIIALARYNSDGSLDNTFGTDGKLTTDVGNEMLTENAVIQPNGKIVVIASKFNSYESILVRYNKNGSLDNNFGTNGIVTPNIEYVGTGLSLQFDGKILLAGSHFRNFAIGRYNRNGSLDANFGRGGSVVGRRNTIATCLATQFDGKIIAAGTGYDDDNRCLVLARYNAEIPIYFTSFSATRNISLATIVLNWTTSTEVNNSGFVIEATKNSFTKSLKSSKVIWEKIGAVKAHGIKEMGKIYTFHDKSHSGYKFYRLKQISADGSTKYSDIVSISKSKIKPFGKTKLFKNYPNPFNPSTQISFTLANAGDVNVSVYNALGQKVAELVNGNMNAGTHKVEFNGSNLSSGFYVYRLETPNYSKTMKMLLLK